MRFLRNLTFVTLLAATAAWCAPALATDLMEVYRLARRGDPVFRAAVAQHSATLQAEPMALAGLLPNLTASGAYGWNRYEKTQPTSSDQESSTEGESTESNNENSVQHYRSRRLGVTLTQPLVSPQDWVNYSRASAQVRMSAALLAAARQHLILRVVQQYLRVLAARDELAFIRSQRRAIGRSLARARRASRLGLISPTEEHRAQASYDLIAARELAAENQLAARREELAEITGRPVSHLFGLSPGIPLKPPAPADPKHWTTLALKNNRELAARKHAVDEARLELRRRQAGFFPTLNLSASHVYSDEEGGRLPGEDQTGAILLELRLPLFQGGMVLAQTREARHLLQKAQQDHERQRREVVRRVRNSLRNVQAAIKQVLALRQAERSSQAVVAAAEKGFALGSTSFIEVLEAVRDLFQARRDLSRARHDYLMARLEMAAVVGDLNESHVAAINALLRPPPPASAAGR